jgi:hypothetical protein
VFTIICLFVDLSDSPYGIVCQVCHFAQNYWVFGPCPSSGIIETRKHNVPETGVFSSSGERGETPTLLGSLERANFNHWITD